MLRRAARARRDQRRHPRGGSRLRGGSERGRQDHVGELAHRAPHPDHGRSAVHGRDHRGNRPGAACRTRSGAFVSTYSDFPAADGRGNHRRRGCLAAEEALANFREPRARSRDRCAGCRSGGDLRPRATTGGAGRDLVPGRKEGARRRIGLRARSAHHPARRADLRRFHRRKAWDHAHPDRGRKARRRAKHRAGRARHGSGRGLFAADHRAFGGARAGRSAARAVLRRSTAHRERDRQAQEALMLSAQDLSVDVQGSRVLRGISFEIKAGELVYLVGRNGAGKTTTFRTIMGFRKPAAGAITFDGVDLAGLRPYQVARLGVGFAPEESEVFGELTVAENIALPTWVHPQAGPPTARIEEAYRVFPALERYRARGGHALSGGERKMVSIARALALGPKLLLLDEPTEGLSPVIVPSIIQGLASIRAFGHALFIAESNIHHVPDFADRLYVIERGEVIFAGKPEAAANDPVVARIVGGASAAAGGESRLNGGSSV